MVRNVFFAACLVAAASARVSKRTASLGDSTSAGWAYKECVEITSGYPVIGQEPKNFAGGYTPQACQDFCLQNKNDSNGIKYAAVTEDFCECYGDELDGNTSTSPDEKCETLCPDSTDAYCGTHEDGDPGDWYYAVYEYSGSGYSSSSSSSSLQSSSSSSSSSQGYGSSTASSTSRASSYSSASSASSATSATSYAGSSTSSDPATTSSASLITSTITKTVVETVTKCPDETPDCPHKKTMTLTTTTCYPAAQYTKSYDETVTITKCPDTVVECPYKSTTTSVKPCSSVVDYDPSASYVCGNDLCAKPTGSDKSSSSDDKSCYGASCGSKSYNSSHPIGTGAPGCTGPACYKTADATRETVVAAVALAAGFGLSMAALF